MNPTFTVATASKNISDVDASYAQNATEKAYDKTDPTVEEKATPQMATSEKVTMAFKNSPANESSLSHMEYTPGRLIGEYTPGRLIGVGRYIFE